MRSRSHKRSRRRLRNRARGRAWRDCSTKGPPRHRHGTTTLFAALDTRDGKVITLCKPRHRHQEFLAFLNHLDRSVPTGVDVHLVADNRRRASWSSAGFGQRARYHSDCRTLRRSSECLVRSSSAYVPNRHRVPVPSSTGLCGSASNGSRAHAQVGHMIETQVDLAYRGGMLMSSRLIWPAVTAWR
jgi:hypothetical protein